MWRDVHKWPGKQFSAESKYVWNFFLNVLRDTIKWSATGLILVKTPIGPENFIPNPLDISLIAVHMEFTQNVRASGKRTDALRGEYRLETFIYYLGCLTSYCLYSPRLLSVGLLIVKNGATNCRCVQKNNNFVSTNSSTKSWRQTKYIRCRWP